MNKLDSLFDKLVQSEEHLYKVNFFGPVFSSNIRIKLNGILLDLKVQPSNFRGWGKFTTTDCKTANLVGQAERKDIGRYLELYPLTSLIVVNLDRAKGMTLDKHHSIHSFCLADNIELFDTIKVRFDGNNYLFDSVDTSRSKYSSQLRKFLNDKVKPDNISYSGLTLFEKVAYAFGYKLEQDKYVLTTEGKIKDSIRRAGGEFNGYRNNGDNLTVTYMVDGESYTSTFDKNLRCTKGGAGICLSGYDNNFDLQSLITVIREGQNKDRIVRF